MQNKANFKTEVRRQMTDDGRQKTVRSDLTKDYEKEPLSSAYSADAAAKAGSQKQTQTKPVLRLRSEPALSLSKGQVSNEAAMLLCVVPTKKRCFLRLIW